VTGDSLGKTSDADYATVAYNASTGGQLWAERYNGPGNGNDQPHSFGVSPNGPQVFVTGVSVGSTSDSDYATLAYDSSTGAREWLRRYNGPGNGVDEAWSLSVNPSGSTVYVTGESIGLTSGYDYATLAYAS
jgi:hypothetical protein